VRDSRQDIVAGLEAGANDYVTKPFDRSELLTRVKIGLQMVKLQSTLITRVEELDKALTEVRLLGKLLPICSYCKKIRDDKNYWQQVEGYITKHAQVQFTHGICPTCAMTQWGAPPPDNTN
jgi:DNA-binding response OmpR family regulator